jgi:hypothetical protein
MHLLNQQRSHIHLLMLQYHSTFNTSVFCMTNLAPPVTSSTELAGGMLKSFAMYLSVDPVTETQTSIAIAAAVVFVTLTPITASFEFAVNIVLALLVACALYLVRNLVPYFILLKGNCHGNGESVTGNT